MRYAYRSVRLMSVMTAATALLMIALSPTTALPPRIAAGFRRFRDDENGELVQNILWVAGFAAIAIAVIAIIRTFVLKEAQNLPTSDTVIQ